MPGLPYLIDFLLTLLFLAVFLLAEFLIKSYSLESHRNNNLIIQEINHIFDIKSRLFKERGEKRDREKANYLDEWGPISFFFLFSFDPSFSTHI